MDSTFTQELLQLETPAHVLRAIKERRDRIMQAIDERTLEPTSDVIKELAELNIALGDVGASDG